MGRYPNPQGNDGGRQKCLGFTAFFFRNGYFFLYWNRKLPYNLEMLDRRIGQRRDATRAPTQARNGWRPSATLISPLHHLRTTDFLSKRCGTPQTSDSCLSADCTIERYIGSLRNGAGGTTAAQKGAPR